MCIRDRIVSLVILLGVVQVSFPTVFSNDNTNIAVTENLPDDYYQYKPANSQIAEIQDSNIMDNEFVAALANINFTQLILMFLFFFITGYFLYASLYAAIGGAVDNNADTQQFMLPITLQMCIRDRY